MKRRVIDVAKHWGVQVAGAAVCIGHCAPADFLTDWLVDRPSLSLVVGPRGGGKSYLAGLATHVDSIRRPGHTTKILGGSEAQSQQVYLAIRDFHHADPRDIVRANAERSVYKNGSEVSILTASSKSVRGPHVPTLQLDEVDEIDPEIRQAAMGMSMARRGVSASVRMTSTWHNLGGPVAELIDKAAAGDFPLYRFCAFEVLERCPEERSGPNLENCPACPLARWCRDTPDGVPKAKRSAGHYAIDSLIQKVKSVSLRVFEADYLCLGPKADGLWFPQFDAARHVSERAEYDPDLEARLAVDSGVFTGGVYYQTRENPDGGPPIVTVFGDYLSEGLSAEANARALLRLAESLCGGRIDYRWTDPAGGARNPVGPTVLEEYRRCGLPLAPWPKGSVADGLALIESALEAADGSQRLWIHPRCRHLIAAFQGYRRAKRSGQWMDWPEDPQHPHEDLMDTLRGGMVADSRRAPAGVAMPPALIPDVPVGVPPGVPQVFGGFGTF